MLFWLKCSFVSFPSLFFLFISSFPFIISFLLLSLTFDHSLLFALNYVWFPLYFVCFMFSYFAFVIFIFHLLFSSTFRLHHFELINKKFISGECFSIVIVCTCLFDHESEDFFRFLLIDFLISMLLYFSSKHFCYHLRIHCVDSPPSIFSRFFLCTLLIFLSICQLFSMMSYNISASMVP